jgi:hypothetical protein
MTKWLLSQPEAGPLLAEAEEAYGKWSNFRGKGLFPVFHLLWGVKMAFDYYLEMFKDNRDTPVVDALEAARQPLKSFLENFAQTAGKDYIAGSFENVDVLNRAWKAVVDLYREVNPEAPQRTWPTEVTAAVDKFYSEIGKTGHLAPKEEASSPVDDPFFQKQNGDRNRLSEFFTSSKLPVLRKLPGAQSCDVFEDTLARCLEQATGLRLERWQEKLAMRDVYPEMRVEAPDKATPTGKIYWPLRGVIEALSGQELRYEVHYIVEPYNTRVSVMCDSGYLEFKKGEKEHFWEVAYQGVAGEFWEETLASIREAAQKHGRKITDIHPEEKVGPVVEGEGLFLEHVQPNVEVADALADCLYDIVAMPMDVVLSWLPSSDKKVEMCVSGADHMVAFRLLREDLYVLLEPPPSAPAFEIYELGTREGEVRIFVSIGSGRLFRQRGSRRRVIPC